MYSRKNSLKTRYNFRKALKYGNTFYTPNLIIKYIEGDEKRFGIITSSKFHKSTVVQNKARRVIAEALRKKMYKLSEGYHYVIIPKKVFIHKDGKIRPDVKEISTEIDTFLSEMVIARSRIT